MPGMSRFQFTNTYTHSIFILEHNALLYHGSREEFLVTATLHIANGPSKSHFHCKFGYPILFNVLESLYGKEDRKGR